MFLPKILASNAFSQEFLFSLRKGFSFFLLTNDRNIHFFSSQIIELFIFLLTNNRDIPVFLVLLSLVKRSLLLLHGDLNKFPGNLKNLEIRPQILGFDSLYNWAKDGLRPARPRLDCRARIQLWGVLDISLCASGAQLS